MVEIGLHLGPEIGLRRDRLGLRQVGDPARVVAAAVGHDRGQRPAASGQRPTTSDQRPAASSMHQRHCTFTRVGASGVLLGKGDHRRVGAKLAGPGGVALGVLVMRVSPSKTVSR